jgi:hypothetical protein
MWEAIYSPHVPPCREIVGADVVADGKVLGSCEVELEFDETRLPTCCHLWFFLWYYTIRVYLMSTLYIQIQQRGWSFNGWIANPPGRILMSECECVNNLTRHAMQCRRLDFEVTTDGTRESERLW